MIVVKAIIVGPNGPGCQCNNPNTKLEKITKNAVEYPLFSTITFFTPALKASSSTKGAMITGNKKTETIFPSAKAFAVVSDVNPSLINNKEKIMLAAIKDNPANKVHLMSLAFSLSINNDLMYLKSNFIIHKAKNSKPN